MSTPTSIINICSGVRLTNNYNHTIWFDSINDQLNYFAGKVVKTFPAYTYIRKNWSLKVDATMEQARQWSYLYFKNGPGKTYFYFINNIEYINDNTVELFIEMDVMQSYLFDYTLQQCFVEREHAKIDTIGSNTIEEGLELGELIVNSQHNIDLSTLCLLVMATFDPQQTSEEYTDTVIACVYDSVYSGLGIYAINMDDWGAWANKIKLLDDYGKSDGIVTMWMYPKNLVVLEEGESWGDDNVSHRVLRVDSFNVDYTRPSTINEYIPKNKKLLCYPYNFLYASNNSGGAAAYKYERFYDAASCTFKVSGALSPEGSAVIYPLNYNGAVLNYEEGLTLGGFPTCAWNQDVYKLWLAQNQNTQNLQLGMSALTIAGGAITTLASAGVGAVAGVGAMVSGASQIAGVLAQRADMQVQPAQAKGNFSSGVNTVNGFQTFTIQKKSVDAYHAKIIDDYFSMYGYKTNLVKVPERNCRQAYTYTKTIGCQVLGNLCNEDLVKIQSVYDNGVTFWKDGDNIGNYAVDNFPLE